MEQARGPRKNRAHFANKTMMVTPAEAAAEKAVAEAQRAEEAAEITAEAGQISFEEAALAKVVVDDPTLADTVETQRKDITVRKKMLDLRRQALTPPGSRKP